MRTDKSLACWGFNGYGQATPPAGTSTSVGAGQAFTCGVRTDGTIDCWGINLHGESFPPSGTFKSLSAGTFHGCGVRTDGSVACWGRNDNGQAPPGESVGLGSGTPPPTVEAVPLVATEGRGLSAESDVIFTSTAPGQGYIHFAPGPGCTGLVGTTTQDLGAGTTRHFVTVAGDEMNLMAGAVLPGATYSCEVDTVTSKGVELDNNGGECYTVTIPSS